MSKLRFAARSGRAPARPSPLGPPDRQRPRAQGWVPKMLSAERFLRSGGQKGSSGALTGGGPTRTMSGPVTVTLLLAISALAAMPDSPDQLMPRGIGVVSVGAGCGRWRGRRARQPPQT